MCTKSTKLKFCSCKPAPDDHQDEDQLCTWTLCRLITIDETDKRLGKIMPPANSVGNDISIENVLSAINTKNVFDFEYLPKEDDTIHIAADPDKGSRKYFSVIYKAGKWIKGNNPAFKSRTQEIKSGFIKNED